MEEIDPNGGYKFVRGWLSLSIIMYILEFKNVQDITEEMMIKWENRQLEGLEKTLAKAGYGIFPRERVPEAFLK